MTAATYPTESRDTLHRLVDKLPESELTAAERFLRYLRVTTDPVLRALLEAPLDDEPEAEEERQAVHEAREELACGEVRTLEDVRRELGLRAGRSSSPPVPNGTSGDWIGRWRPASLVPLSELAATG